MANVKFPRKEFEKALGKLISQEIEEKIHLFGTPIESISNEEIELEIFPNRPDLLSMQGFLRSFKAFLGDKKSLGLRKYPLKKPEKDFKIKIEPSVKEIRPYTVCAIVKRLKLTDESIKEIIELQEKLHNTLGRNRRKVAIGIYPLEKIKLPITYKAMSPEKIKFVPLEYDKELSGKQILTKHPTGKEYAHLLENFDKFPVFIDAKNSILSMPPIINSHETGKITESTSEVFVECSGSDFQTLNKTLNIIVTTLSDFGGEIYQMSLDYGDKKFITPSLNSEKINISLEEINKLLGIDLKESDLKKLLPRMGYNYKNKEVEIPAWRCDILHRVDITEDIAIAYGYDKFIPKIPKISTIGEESKESKFSTKLREILIGLGLIEISSYHLIKQEEAKLFKLKNPLEVFDSKTEYKILRPNLLIPALRILSENKDSEYPQKIFEIGTVFNLDKKETSVSENENLIIVFSPANFTDLKQILEYLFSSLELNYKLEESEYLHLIQGRTASIYINNKNIGYIGEVHPQTLSDSKIKMPVSVIELSLEHLF